MRVDLRRTGSKATSLAWAYPGIALLCERLSVRELVTKMQPFLAGEAPLRLHGYMIEPASAQIDDQWEAEIYGSNNDYCEWPCIRYSRRLYGYGGPPTHAIRVPLISVEPHPYFENVDELTPGITCVELGSRSEQTSSGSAVA